MIGLLDVQGIEVFVEPGLPKTTRIRVEMLPESNVSQWLERDSVEQSVQQGLRLKVLLAEQAGHQDDLRPDSKIPAVRFSRQTMCKHFGYPRVALDKLSSNDHWMLDFAKDHMGTDVCVGFGTADIGMLWTRQNNHHGHQIVRAVVVFFSKNSTMRARLLDDIRRLCDCYEGPAFLLFLVLNRTLAFAEEKMNYCRQTIDRTDSHMEWFGHEKNAAAMHVAARFMTRMLVGLQRDVKTMLKITKKCLNMGSGDQMNCCREFSNVFGYLNQRIEAISEDCEECLRHLSQQLDSRLSIMAQAQQELSIEIARGQSRLAETTRTDQAISLGIAEASKKIAEDTRRDGTSMNILAVVGLVYLPASTMASIMAMPFFDWGAADGGIVNPRIWVYIAFAGSLTILTVSLWYLWLKIKRPESGKPEKYDRC